MTDPRVRRCLERGMSVLVGTVDEHGRPSCCRALALTSNDDLATVTAYVPVATSRAVIADIAATRRMAVVANQPIEHLSFQLKGTTGTTRLARDDERDVVRDHVDGFGDVLNDLGVPRRITRSLTYWPAFAIELQVEEIFEQTPGPKAGARLR